MSRAAGVLRLMGLRGIGRTLGAGVRTGSVNGVVMPSGMGGDVEGEECLWTLKGTIFGFCSQVRCWVRHQAPDEETARQPSSDQWRGSARSRWCLKLIHGCVRWNRRSSVMVGRLVDWSGGGL